MSQQIEADDLDEAEAWALLFNEFGEETLREILLKAFANDGRTVIEFRNDQAMEITTHVETLEDGL